MKKKLSILLVSTVLALSLIACGEDYEEDVATSSEQEEAVVDEADAAVEQEEVVAGEGEAAEQLEWLMEQMAVVISFEEEYYSIVSASADGAVQALYDALCELSGRTTIDKNYTPSGV